MAGFRNQRTHLFFEYICITCQEIENKWTVLVGHPFKNCMQKYGPCTGACSQHNALQHMESFTQQLYSQLMSYDFAKHISM